MKPKFRRMLGRTPVTLTVQPAQPAFAEPADPQGIPETTPFEQHRDGCGYCDRAIADGDPLCVAGAKLHRARASSGENGTE